jgi:hypothetical protein
MTDYHCYCGYAAASADDLTDHLAEMFTPDGDAAADGQRHAEAADDTPWPALPPTRRCLCGFEAGDIAQLDVHLLTAFTPADAVGRDGNRHTATVNCA